MALTALAFDVFLIKYRGQINPSTNQVWDYAAIAMDSGETFLNVQAMGNFTQNYNVVFRAKYNRDASVPELVAEWNRVQSAPKPPAPPVQNTVPLDNKFLSAITVGQLKQILNDSNAQLLKALKQVMDI
jgi:hypothetical protein